MVNLESGNTYYNPMISFYFSQVYQRGDNNINKEKGHPVLRLIKKKVIPKNKLSLCT